MNSAMPLFVLPYSQKRSISRMKRRILMLPVIPMMVFGLMLISLFQASGVEAASPSQHVLGTVQHHVNAPATNLIYHGGPVMVGTSKDYAIFSEPTGSYV